MQEVNSIKHSNFIPSGWKSQKLIDFCINSKRAIVDGPFGSNLKSEHFREFGIPVINSSFVTDFSFKADKYVYVDEELFLREIRSKVEPGDIIMAKIGARCGSTAIMPVNHPISILSGNSLKISINTDENVTDFVWYILADLYQKNQMKDYKSVGAQPSISTPLLKEMKILRPPKIEQQKIAEILSTWDKAIELCQKTIEELRSRNKGLAQQLLSGRKKVKGFEDSEWSFVRFKEIYEPHKKLAQEIQYEILSVTKSGIVSQSEYFNRNVASENTSNYLVVERGDFLVSGLNFWMGSYDVLDNFEIGIISPAYKVYRLKSGYSNQFFKHFVHGVQMRFAMISASVVGASIVRRNFDLEALYEYAFKIPNFEEQKAIAKILDAAASELKHYEEKLNNLKLQKKGLMQQLLTGKVRTI